MTVDCIRPRPLSRRGHRACSAALSVLLGVACSFDDQQTLAQPSSEQPGEDADKSSTEGALPGPNGEVPGAVATTPLASTPNEPGGTVAPSTPLDPGAPHDPSSPHDPSAPPDPNAPVVPNQPSGPGPLPWSPAPPLRNAVTLSDAALATQALTLLGSAAVGAQGSCRSCHSLGRPTLTRWAQLTAELTSDCLTNTQLPDVPAVDAMLGCFRQRAGKPGARFMPQSFGVYAAAAQLPWFSFVFQHASAVTAGTATHAEFVTRVGMPVVGQPWTQAEFDVVAEWFARRLPGMFELIPEESGEACTVGLDPELTRYVDGLGTSGWRAKNEQVPLLMYGCGPGQRGSACLSELPRASSETLGAGWENLPGTQIRLLHDNSDALSFYWSRSSADGRYIGSGVLEPERNDGYGGQIVDLEQEYTIAGDFAYDATFFPDNSAFLMQQSNGPSGSVALICPQSVLAELPDTVNGEEQGCTLADGAFGLYQQTAQSLDGDDYLVVHGTFESDDGGFSPVFEQPSAAFDASSSVVLTPLINTGEGFEVGADEELATPLQGDPTLSPSGGLLVLRVKGREYATTNAFGFDVIAAEQSGYALYRVAQDAGGVDVRDLGRICLRGGKATFSYDERWLVFHHYVEPEDAQSLGFSGPNDPAFAAYRRSGASNLMLVDLRTGSARRITGMMPGQYALFPHFRSDGWIYFVVRTLDGTEYFAASDAALVLE